MNFLDGNVVKSVSPINPMPVNQSPSTSANQAVVTGNTGGANTSPFAQATIGVNAFTLTSNASRKATVIHNNTTATLYLLFGTGTVSATNFTTKLAAADTLATTQMFTGVITGMLSATGSGYVHVTELV